MAGGLFSIDKFFERLRTYDSGFDIWGGENLQLSFNTWICGGALEIITCSYMGHIFRKRTPYKWKFGVNVLRKNSVRLAEVWLDEYKKYYYNRIGNDLIRNLGDGGDTCLNSASKRDDFHKPIGLWPCHNQCGNQYWMFSKEGEIKRDEACLDSSGGDVILYPCHGAGGNQMWIYDPNHFLTRSPTMAGGLFSIDKKFFERLRTYDSGFDVWGGENLELSFKTY